MTVYPAKSWEPHHVEHLACRAAEVGDEATERTCDEVLAGTAEVGLLVSIVANDGRYEEWMQRGIHLGWQTRAR